MQAVGLLTKPESGVVLPTCLLLAGLIGLLGIAALRATATETRSIAAAVDRYRNSLLAEQGLGSGLDFAESSPEHLPVSGETLTLASTATLPSDQELEITISHTGADTECPEYPDGRRVHYEIVATARLDSGAGRSHVQGFAVCSELCSEPDCIAAVSPARRTYWTYRYDR
jgi:hypothetical protein